MTLVLDPEKIISQAERLGASEAEVYIVKSREYSVKAQRDAITEAEVHETLKLGVRVAVSKRIGGAGGIIATMDDVESIIGKAISIAKTAPPDEKWPGFNPRIGVAPFKPEIYDETTAGVDTGFLIGLLVKQLGIVREAENVHVAEAGIGVDVSETIYANSHGGPVSEKATLFSYGYELKRGGEEKGTYYDYIVKTRLEEDKVYSLTRKGVEKVIDASRAEAIGSFNGDIILGQEEAASIVAIMLAPAVSAEQVQKGRSPLRGKLGEDILSRAITVVDDPFLSWEPGSSAFDDEGHPTMKKNIFERGVLKTYLYDYYTASVEGKESTGNADRRAPWSKPSPGPTNLVVEVEDSKSSIDELIAGIEKGVLVERTIGSWMSNPISGQVNMTISFGYLVEKGSIAKPVKGLVVADDFYEALKDRFLGAGGQRECFSGVCTPSIAWTGIRFAGKD